MYPLGNWLTGLDRLLRSRHTTKSFVKNFGVFIWEGKLDWLPRSWFRQPRSWQLATNFPIWTLHPITGTTLFWQNSFAVAAEWPKWHYFTLHVFQYLSWLGWNFSYEEMTKFAPVTESAQSTGLIWRGPKLHSQLLIKFQQVVQ